MRKEKNDKEEYMKVKKLEKMRKRYGTRYWWGRDAVTYKKNELKTGYQKSPEGKFKAAQVEAAQKKLEFKIGKTAFKELVTKDCFYCGETGGEVDRAHPSMGFNEGNVVPSCSTCKDMKGRMDYKVFFAAAMSIASHVEKNPNIF